MESQTPLDLTLNLSYRANMEDTGEANKEAVRLWRVWKTVRQMCRDRVRRFHDLVLCPL